mgnify:CR=1 FL=1
MRNILKFLKTKIINLCLNKVENIAIGSLFEDSIQINYEKIDGPDGRLKFIAWAGGENRYVSTPTGFKKIKKILKTIPYEIWELTLSDGKQLKCADTHIVITISGQKYVKDLIINEDEILTENGKSKVVSLLNTRSKESMYDLELYE